MKYLILLLVFTLGCRHCRQSCIVHVTEKPKMKQKLTSRLESGTKLYAEGFGPNKDNGKYGASPYEAVDLKAILEYSLEW